MTVEPVAVSWLELAACRGRGELFFAADGFSQRVACAVCRHCEVRTSCLAAALVEEAQATYRYGVRGGLTPSQRHPT